MNIPSLARATALAVILVASSLPSYAQVEIGASPNPVGSGARAVGMGGAFIAVADDATAASWNPAGLVQLEKPEVSAVGNWSYRRESVSSSNHPEIGGVNISDGLDLNYLSGAYPFTLLNRNMIVSVNYQRLYDFNKDFKGGFNQTVGPFEITSANTFFQRGGLSAVSPAFAAQVTPELSVGFTVNFWEDPFGRNGWEATTDRRLGLSIGGVPIITVNRTTKDVNDFSGTNFNAGVMYSPNSRLTLAAVYKSGFIADVRRERVVTDSTLTPRTVRDTEYLNLTMPESYGGGVSYRFSDALTAALDVYRTEWGEFILNENGTESRPNIGRLESKSKMDATTQARLGAEYLFIRQNYTVPLRAGAFYDPDPSEAHPNTFWGLSAGTGVSYGPVAFDAAYSFRTGSTEESLNVGGADSSVTQHTFIFSAIWHL